jgi:AcrR family transcriptional regulator
LKRTNGEVTGGRDHSVLEEDSVHKGEKREAILQAALELVAENGLQHTPMSQISRRSGASAGIIYHYFEGKDDLLETLYWRIKRDMMQAVAAADDTRQPLARRFQTLWLSIFRYYLAHPLEIAFLQQYESVPKRHGALPPGKAKTLDTLIEYKQALLEDLPQEEKALHRLFKDLCAQDLVKDLPLKIIEELTIGVALRLALQVTAGLLSLDEATLNEIAKACWDAIAR